MRKIVAAAIILTVISGCDTFRDYRMQRSLAVSRAASLAKIDPEECRRKNGTIRQVGMFGTPSCVVPLPDAGKVCRSNSECAGFCFAPTGVVVGQAATGTCQIDKAAMFGCRDQVENGVVVGGMCVD
ncbi:hypothetical protein [Lysobacter claricitrinus]|uniref:hypothetical protein n=1 Tax=Lysobacter claricitrinus TaxID=3367728 RepID=UPI0037DBDB29